MNRPNHSGEMMTSQAHWCCSRCTFDPRPVFSLTLSRTPSTLLHFAFQTAGLGQFSVGRTVLTGAVSGQRQHLLQANEMSAAQHASSVIADNYSDLFDPLSATQLAARLTEAEQDSREDDLHLLKSNQAKAAQMLLGLREMTDAAMTQPLLFEHLASRELSGQAYLNAINAQDQHSIILLTP